MNYFGNDKIVSRNVYEILSLDPNIPEQWEIIDKQYNAVGIHEVKIDGNVFTNYGDFQFIWEKSYVKEPTRSGNGSIGNLNSFATFLTPHLIINFSVISIDDYRRLMQLHYSKNEFTVECYDPIYNQKIKVKMYFTTEQMAKLFMIAKKRFNGREWEDWIELVGAREYSVELIGTNNDLDLVSVAYNYNAPLDENGNPIYPSGSPIPPQYEPDVYMGEEIVVGGNSTFPNTPPSNDYVFDHWTTTPNNSGTFYTNGNVITVNGEMTLYAQWKKPEARKLSYNYGLSTAEIKSINQSTGEPIYRYDDPVNKGEPIPTLPTFETEPTVENKNTGEKIPAYENGGWYKHPVKDEDLRVRSGDLYWLDRDTIIYLLYDTKKFEVVYNANDPNPSALPQLNIPSQMTEYGATVYLPNLYKANYTFQGWYLDSVFKTAFTGKMPPKKITLYAKWEKAE